MISTGRPCPTPRKSMILACLPSSKTLTLSGLEISHWLAAAVGQAEIEFDAAIGIEMVQARISD